MVIFKDKIINFVYKNPMFISFYTICSLFAVTLTLKIRRATRPKPAKKRFSVLGGGEIESENADEIVEALRAPAFAKYERTADG